MRAGNTPWPLLLALLSGCTEYGTLPPGAASTLDDPEDGPTGEGARTEFENHTFDYRWASSLKQCSGTCAPPTEETARYEPLGNLTAVDLELRWSSPAPLVHDQLSFSAVIENRTGSLVVKSLHGPSPLSLRNALDPAVSANHTLVLRVDYHEGMKAGQSFQVTGSLTTMRTKGG